ncbi:hypothetical protein DPMN_086313 [Dreissena polymorpha]|uniref:Uncharacterized protein n=1 Tax=Dreissena polymorpha TaxID=45954 RepID=A0A9D4KRL8_DREPO|nr:hypothetical protein DPMN_086313 [Dreissena polymorpha]
MNRTVDPKPRSKEIVTVSVASLATTGLPTKSLWLATVTSPTVLKVATITLPTVLKVETVKSANVLKTCITDRIEQTVIACISQNPVNPEQATVYPDEAPTEPRLSPVMPRWNPGKSRQRSGKAPVYRYSAETRRGYPVNRPRQSYGNAPI